MASVRLVTVVAILHLLSSITVGVELQSVKVGDISNGVRPLLHEGGNREEEESAVNGGEGESKWWMRLIHRDVMRYSYSRFTNSSQYWDVVEERMRRDQVRVAGLNQQLTGSGDGNVSQIEEMGWGLTSETGEGSGEYFVRVGVGSPPVNQYMVIDTGSDIVWLQCKPCTQCYRQTDPVFDPSESATFTGVGCRSAACDRLVNAGCHRGQCRYEVMYGDGSYTKGSLALETLTFGSTVVRNVAIGCGRRNRGLFVGAAGILGLGGGSLSLIGQLGGHTGGAFGYCLASRGAASSGWLMLGPASLPATATWVPLLRNPRAPSFYYVGLAGIGVGGSRLAFSDDFFRLNQKGHGGMVIDTGTAVTRLPSPAYAALRNAFLALTASLPPAPAVSIFDTCYDLRLYTAVQVPTVSFFFTGGPILTLPARNFLVPVNAFGTFCFAFAPSESSLSILGNIQQEGIQISIDAANGLVGFGPSSC